MRTPLLLLPLLASTLFGQTQAISPVQAASVEGSASQQIPFNNGTARRYLQLHSDLPVTALLITKLAFRQNGGNTVDFTGTRAIDLELFMSNSAVPYDRASTLFANNHGTRTNTIARRVVTFGPQGINQNPGPAPFQGMELLLDTPFVRTATSASLVWEAVIYGNVLTGTFNALDADQSSITPAVVASTGAGCIATGQTLRMAHGLACQDVAGTLLFGVTTSVAPANAAAVLALGVSNPNQPITGLCSNVYTDLTVLLPLPNVDANGLIQADTGYGFVLPNTFAGATIYSQIHAIDNGRADAIKICNSGGLATTIPTSNTSKRLQVSRVWNNVGGTTATVGTFAADTMVGYSLVTRFQ